VHGPLSVQIRNVLIISCKLLIQYKLALFDSVLTGYFYMGSFMWFQVWPDLNWHIKTLKLPILLCCAFHL